MKRRGERREGAPQQAVWINNNCAKNIEQEDGDDNHGRDLEKSQKQIRATEPADIDKSQKEIGDHRTEQTSRSPRRRLNSPEGKTLYRAKPQERSDRSPEQNRKEERKRGRNNQHIRDLEQTRQKDIERDNRSITSNKRRQQEQNNKTNLHFTSSLLLFSSHLFIHFK